MLIVKKQKLCTVSLHEAGSWIPSFHKRGMGRPSDLPERLSNCEEMQKRGRQPELPPARKVVAFR
jgi:hypothetical protein